MLPSLPRQPGKKPVRHHRDSSPNALAERPAKPVRSSRMLGGLAGRRHLDAARFAWVVGHPDGRYLVPVFQWISPKRARTPIVTNPSPTIMRTTRDPLSSRLPNRKPQAAFWVLTTSRANPREKTMQAAPTRTAMMLTIVSSKVKLRLTVELSRPGGRRPEGSA